MSAENRDAIQDLKVSAEKKEFDILLVFMFDRLGRIENETPFVLQWFVKAGVEVWSTKEGQQTFENDVDYLMNYIRFWQAAGESRKTSMRVKTKMGQMVEAGQFTGGVCPLGYRFIKSGLKNKKGKELLTLEIVPEEAAIVIKVFNKTINEGIGTWRLSDILNELGYRTHSGARFQPNTINRILRNPIYTGRFVRGGKISQVIPELKIIEDYLFEEAQKILFARSGKRDEKMSIAFTTRGAALLSGNIYCGHCGRRMYAVSYLDTYTLADGTKKSTRRIKYLCPNSARKRGECDGQSQYVSTKIDEVVLETVNAMLSKIKGSIKDETIKQTYEKTIKLKKDVYCDLLNQKTKEEEKLKKLLVEVANSLVDESKFSTDTLNSSIDLVKKRISELEIKIPSVLGEVNEQKKVYKNIDNYYEQLMDWTKSFEKANNAEKKMIICKLIDRIEISRGYNVTMSLNMDYEQFMLA